MCSVLDKVYTLMIEEQYISALHLVRAAHTVWPDLDLFQPAARWVLLLAWSLVYGADDDRQ